MPEDRVHRRLAAILAADVVGYSRLVRADEERTLSAVKFDIEEIFVPRAEVHAGRIFKRMGDGLLIEFSSAVEAVKFAVDVQAALALRASGGDVSQQIEFRIGINLGDVVTEDGDLQGDGVNVAARLEELAQPGGILVSASTFEQVRDKLEYFFEDMGEQRLKNIERPVRAYRVVSVAAPTNKLSRAARHFSTGVSWHRLAIIVSMLMIAAAGGLAIWRPWEHKLETASIERMAFALPEKPSIAVLPFNNLSTDRKQEYFVDGMTEDLITDLSKLSGLFVIARNSVFVYKGKPAPT